MTTYATSATNQHPQPGGPPAPPPKRGWATSSTDIATTPYRNRRRCKRIRYCRRCDSRNGGRARQPDHTCAAHGQCRPAAAGRVQRFGNPTCEGGYLRCMGYGCTINRASQQRKRGCTRRRTRLTSACKCGCAGHGEENWNGRYRVPAGEHGTRNTTRHIGPNRPVDKGQCGRNACDESA